MIRSRFLRMAKSFSSQGNHSTPHQNRTFDKPKNISPPPNKNFKIIQATKHRQVNQQKVKLPEFRDIQFSSPGTPVYDFYREVGRKEKPLLQEFAYSNTFREVYRPLFCEVLEGLRADLDGDVFENVEQICSKIENIEVVRRRRNDGESSVNLVATFDEKNPKKMSVRRSQTASCDVFVHRRKNVRQSKIGPTVKLSELAAITPVSSKTAKSKGNSTVFAIVVDKDYNYWKMTFLK